MGFHSKGSFGDLSWTMYRCIVSAESFAQRPKHTSPIGLRRPQPHWSLLLCHILILHFLVGGLEHEFYFSIYWECHHPNWRTPSFFRGGRSTTNQYRKIANIDGSFHNIWDVILPIDFPMFQDGYCTTNQSMSDHPKWLMFSGLEPTGQPGHRPNDLKVAMWWFHRAIMSTQKAWLLWTPPTVVPSGKLT